MPQSEPMLLESQLNKIEGGSNCHLCQAGSLCLPLSISTKILPDRIERTQRELKRGQILFKQGQVQDMLIVVCSGAIKSRQHNSNGEERVLGVSIPGEVVGLDSFDRGEYAYDAVATSVTKVCEIRHSDLQSNIASQPKLYQLIMTRMRHDYEVLNSVISRKNAAERLAGLICNLSNRFAATGCSAIDFNLGLSRSELANYLGLANETVSRILTRFSKDGLLAANARRTHIIDLRALKAIAEGTGAY